MNISISRTAMSASKLELVRANLSFFCYTLDFSQIKIPPEYYLPFFPTWNSKYNITKLIITYILLKSPKKYSSVGTVPIQYDSLKNHTTTITVNVKFVCFQRINSFGSVNRHNVNIVYCCDLCFCHKMELTKLAPFRLMILTSATIFAMVAHNNDERLLFNFFSASHHRLVFHIFCYIFEPPI